MLIKCIETYNKYFTKDKRYMAYITGVYLNALDNQSLRFTVAYNMSQDWHEDEFFIKHFKILDNSE